MKDLYVPDKNICIKESMVLWRGRIVFRQYIKGKKHKYGVKFLELCESGGMVQTILIYRGEGTMTSGSLGRAGAMVSNLMEDYLDKGNLLYSENFYNSVSLAKFMTQRSTHLCGTLRFDRKENPKVLTGTKLKKKKDGVGKSR